MLRRMALRIPESAVPETAAAAIRCLDEPRLVESPQLFLGGLSAIRKLACPWGIETE
jgi:hypothetical protein